MYYRPKSKIVFDMQITKYFSQLPTLICTLANFSKLFFSIMLSTICIYWLNNHRQIKIPRMVKHCGDYLKILPGQVYKLVGLSVSVQDVLADPGREKIGLAIIKF